MKEIYDTMFFSYKLLEKESARMINEKVLSEVLPDELSFF